MTLGFEKAAELAVDVMMVDARFKPEKWESEIFKCIRPTGSSLYYTF